MARDNMRRDSARVGEVAHIAGISVERALEILHAEGHFAARAASDSIGEEARRCIADALAVEVKPVAGGYSAEFSVECREDGPSFLRRAILTFSRFGYSDTCWSCGAAGRCRWSFRVMADVHYVVEPAAVWVLTEWSQQRPTVEHAHLCNKCAEALRYPFLSLQERVTADEIEADRLHKRQLVEEKRAREAATNHKRAGLPASEPVTADALESSEMRIAISDKLAAALALTPHRENAKPLGEVFDVEIVPPLGPMARVRLMGEAWTAHAGDGKTLDLDDARVPVLRNIAFGACDLLAEAGGGGPVRNIEPPEQPLPRKLIHPSRRIHVEVNADLRPIVIEILEGTRQYEVATGEAIFVRGHWTHQPWGDGGRERKVIWRQPHYRGKGHRGGRTYAFVEPAARP